MVRYLFYTIGDLTYQSPLVVVFDYLTYTLCYIHNRDASTLDACSPIHYFLFLRVVSYVIFPSPFTSHLTQCIICTGCSIQSETQSSIMKLWAYFVYPVFPCIHLFYATSAGNPAGLCKKHVRLQCV